MPKHKSACRRREANSTDARGKQKDARGKHQIAPLRRGLAAILIPLLGTSIVVTAGIMAGRPAARKSGESLALAPQGTGPASPSKEYIYAGSRLIATDEPTSSCSYSLNPPGNPSVPSGGGPYQVTVNATAGCGWSATSNSSWIIITAGGSGTGNGTVSYTVTPNSSSSSQTGTMIIAGLSFTVTEAGASCSYSIAPTTQSFPSGGGGSSASVSAGSGCGWTATSDMGWLTITSGSSGTGNGTIAYSVAANTGTSSRTGTITARGQTLTVTQAGSCGVTTFSGTGVSGYLEGNATTAEWANPFGVTMGIDPVSGGHALFIADTDNERIRLVYLEGSNTGQSAWIAGTGIAGFHGSNGADAAVAKFNSPTGIAAITNASGVVTALIIADSANDMIRELIPPATQGADWTVNTVSGQPGTTGSTDGNSTTALFNSPQDVVIGTDGFIYVADAANGAVRRVDLQGNTTTIANSSSGLGFITGISVSQSSGLLYIADQSAGEIWQATTAGQTSVIGTGLNKPYHLAWASGDVLYIANRVAQQIVSLPISSGSWSVYAGTGVASWADGACTTVAQFNNPRGVAIGPSGEIYITDGLNDRIRRAQ